MQARKQLSYRKAASWLPGRAGNPAFLRGQHPGRDNKILLALAIQACIGNQYVHNCLGCFRGAVGCRFKLYALNLSLRAFFRGFSARKRIPFVKMIQKSQRKNLQSFATGG
jgi:hypothetical protein